MSSPALPRSNLVPTRSKAGSKDSGRATPVNLIHNPAGIKMREMKLDDLYPIYKLGTVCVCPKVYVVGTVWLGICVWLMEGCVWLGVCVCG